MQTNEIYSNTESYVTDLFNLHEQGRFPFHNLEHTRNVVKATNEITAHEDLTELDALALYVAAWFHDLGYLFTDARNHEEKSSELATKYLMEINADPELIEKVQRCIMATRAPRNPQSKIEEIICDADTYHFGSKEFKTENNEMFEELKLNNSDFAPENFDTGVVTMLTNHEYFTPYAIEKLTKRKKKNIEKMSKKIAAEEESAKAKAKKKAKEQKDPEDVDPKEDVSIKADPLTGEIAEKPSAGSVKAIGKATGATSKGIQTMLRLTSSNHIQLSEMADSKANILISVNAIIISIILSVLVRKIQTEPHLIIPTIVFLLTSVTTIVLAILATRPKVNLGTFNDEDIIAKKTNLLFFGNFHRMSWDSYNDAMMLMMKDPEYLYSSIVQDIYYLGVVLGKKYRLLRIAYSVFMFGIIASVFAFAVASIIHQPVGGESATITNSSGSPF